MAKKSKIKNIVPALLLFASVFSSRASVAAELTLEGYLAEVTAKNDAVKGAARSRSAARETLVDSQLLVEPSFFFNYGLVDDRRPPQSSLFGNEIFSKSYQLGFSETTSFGLSGRLYYQLNETSVYGQQPLPFPGASTFSAPQSTTGSPAIELTQSFLRNGFGGVTQANQVSAQANSLANDYANSFKLKSKMLEAELTYDRLAIAREVVKLEQELVELAQKTVEWADRRTHYNLGDRVDFYQAQAVFQSRNLELQGSRDEARSAARAFNMNRGKDSDDVAETLISVRPETIVDVPATERGGVREDVRAAEQQSRALSAAAEVQKQNTRPQLDLTVAYSYNSLDASTPDAIRESFTPDHPYFKVGLAFSTPLDLSGVAKSQSGHESEQFAAQLNYEQTKFESEQNWKDLTQKFSESKRRLSMTSEVVRLQKTKLDYERRRLNQGRTSAFQVLQFQQDYATAKLNQMNIANQVLQQQAQMKLYGGE